LNLPLAPMWARLLRIPRPYLYAGILVFAAIGAYAADGSTMGLYLLLMMGLLGVLTRRFGLPIVPIIIGVILGPLAELQLRRAMQLSDGDPTALVQSPFSITLYVVVALALIVPVLWRRRPARNPRTTDELAGKEQPEAEVSCRQHRSMVAEPRRPGHWRAWTPLGVHAVAVQAFGFLASKRVGHIISAAGCKALTML
jgi:Tripartite tricarboxylate transporter TctA family